MTTGCTWTPPPASRLCTLVFVYTSLSGACRHFRVSLRKVWVSAEQSDELGDGGVN